MKRNQKSMRIEQPESPDETVVRGLREVGRKLKGLAASHKGWRWGTTDTGFPLYRTQICIPKQEYVLFLAGAEIWQSPCKPRLRTLAIEEIVRQNRRGNRVTLLSPTFLPSLTPYQLLTPPGVPYHNPNSEAMRMMLGITAGIKAIPDEDDRPLIGLSTENACVKGVGPQHRDRWKEMRNYPDKQVRKYLAVGIILRCLIKVRH